MRGGAAALLSVVVLGGCMVREAGPPGVISDYGRWETVRSRHFLVHTDIGRGAIDDVLTRFEFTYQALAETFFPQAVVTDVEALVFADVSEYRQVAGDTAGRFLTGVGSTGSLLVVRHVADLESLDRVVAHELAHRFADASYPGLPHWMDEGIAMYLESVDVREDEVRFGAAPRQGGHGFAVAGGVSFEQLIHVRPNQLYGPEARFYYSAAWGLVHHLLSSRGGALRPRFPRLLAALEQARARNESPRAAFAEIYPDVTAAELDQAIERLTRGLDRPGVDTLVTLRFQRVPPSAFERRPADPPRLHALVAEVQRRNWQAPEPTVDLADRPRFLAADADLAAPLRYAGLVYGHTFRAPFAWEAELGLGPFGWQTAARLRVHHAAGEGGHLFVSAGLGPMLAVKARALGNTVEHPPDRPEPGGLYTFVAVEPQLAAEVRTPSRVLVRLSVSTYVRLLGNLGQLCLEGQRLPARGPSCDPTGRKSGARIAQAGHHVFGRFLIGYTW